MPREEGVRQALAEVGIELQPGSLLRAHYVAMLDYDKRPSHIPDSGWLSFYSGGIARGLGVRDELLERALVGLAPALTGPVAWSQVIQDSIEALPALAASGVPIAIVSNADGTVERVLREQQVCQVGPGPGIPVAAVFDSTVVGAAKPDPKIFEAALKTLGVRPEEVLHVGDSVLADVGGARAAGIRPLHFDPYRICRFDDHEHIRSLTEVVKILG
jgi:putative hydrolase of the HAD superfamily